MNGSKLINEHMQSPFITHEQTESGRSSWIDHVLHTGNLEHVSVLGACNALGEELDDISDHKPLWGLYLTAPPLAARHVRMHRPPPRTELKRSGKCLIAVFQERILDVLHQLPPPGSTQDAAELDMECLTQFTVQLGKEVTDEFKPSGRRSTSYKDGYSSEFMLRKWHLCLVISLKRYMCGLHGKSKWSSHHQIT